MIYNQLATKYAAALFELTDKERSFEKVINELRVFESLLQKNQDILDFLTSPVVRPKAKEQAIKAAIENSGLTEVTAKFLLTLAKKNRLGVFSSIVKAFEAKADAASGVTRGQVISSGVLSTEERSELQKTVEKVTQKRVILSYEEDPENIGGVVAKVGSYTFDDTLTNHLKRLQEELKRSVH